MTDSEFSAEKRYLASVSVAKKMLEKGIIGGKEYREIETILRKKYAPLLSELLSGIDLTSPKI